MECIENGIKDGGKLLHDVRFADDQGIVASTESGLLKTIDCLGGTVEE